MATIYDVAKEASVSAKTVSRVINGDVAVRPNTRDIVKSAIQKLGYVPSNAAQSLRSNKTGLVGLITGALSFENMAEVPSGLPDIYLVQGIQKVFTESNKTLMVADTGGRASTVKGLIEAFLRYRVEALIYVADHHHKVDIDFSAVPCPVFLVNCYDAHGTPCVIPDDKTLQYLLVKRLVSEGHRRIGYITFTPDVEATALRVEGYRMALEEVGISFDASLVLSGQSGLSSPKRGVLADAANLLMALNEPPSVICCGNDEMALRLYGIMREKGLRIPEDISIAGFDDYKRISETLFPPLTTVELPYLSMGRLAAARLMSVIEGGETFDQDPIRLSGSVFWRDSVSSLSQ